MDDLRADFFNVYLCHVCKTRESFSNSKLCSGCKLVSYCSKEHQKADWKSHKKICQISQKFCRESNYENDVYAVGLKAVDFSFYNKTNGMKNLHEFPLEPGSKRTALKSRLGVMIEFHRGQPLDRSELKMIFLPHHCAVCFTRGDVKKELVCTKCFGVGYCSAEHRSSDSDNHEKYCTDYQRVLEMDFFLLKLNRESLETYLIKPSQVSKLKLDAYDMKSFIANYIAPGLKFEEEVLYGIFLTWILTLAHTINRFPNFSVGRSLIIHIVGAHAQCEGEILHYWENLLHLFPQIHDLIIIHISPCIESPPIGSDLCADCKRADKLVTFLFYKQHYHEYQSTIISKTLEPNIIIAFNSGLSEVLDNYDPWRESLHLFFKYKNVPVILTATKENEGKLDLERLRLYAGNKKVRLVVNCEKNPYKNLRPWRDTDDADYGIRQKSSYVSAFIVESD